MTALELELLEALKKITHYMRCTEAVFSQGRMYLDMTLIPALAKEAEAAIAKAESAVSEPVKPVAVPSNVVSQAILDAPDTRDIPRFIAQRAADWAIANTTPPAAVPLSNAEIVDWWNEENGLEDCQMCFKKDFVQVVRAVERKHGIGEKQ